MMTGRLAIIKLAKLSIDEFVTECQKNSKCMLCDTEFQCGDDFLYHAIDKHSDWVHHKLIESLTWQQGHKDLLKPFNPFGDEEEIGEPNTLEYQDRMFQAPRCKKCHHNDPDYTVVGNPSHKDGIRLKCVYCGDISVKD